MKFITQGVTLGTHPTRKLSKHDECERHKKSEEKYVKAKELTFRKQAGQLLVDKMLKCDFSNTEIYSKTVEKNRAVLKKLFKICHVIVRKKMGTGQF